ncbi:MAG: chemotaxis protein CheW [Candidatus Kariarchaeaceae archaeon]|jgi:chemotaxis signal transduction protein
MPRNEKPSTIPELLMHKFANIKFDGISVLLDIGDDYSFHPIGAERQIENVPEYCKGLLELDGTICIVVDLGEFLRIPKGSTILDEILIKVTSDSKDNIAFIVPTPTIVEHDLPTKAGAKQQSEENGLLRVPSSQFFVIENQVKLRLEKEHLLSYIINEVSGTVMQSWGSVVPNWDHLSNLVESDTFISSAPSISESAQTRGSQQKLMMIAQIGDYYFGLDESNILEVIPGFQTISPIPNSPHWIEGVFDFQNNSVVLLNLSKYFDFNNQIDDDEVIVVIKTPHGTFGIYSEQPFTIPFSELELHDLPTDCVLPYLDVTYYDDICIFLLNVDVLEHSVKGISPTIAWTEWYPFLSKNRKLSNTSIPVHLVEAVSGDFLLVQIGLHSFLVALEAVQIIRPFVSNTERITCGQLELVEYQNKWIPSFNLHELLTDNSHMPKFALVLQNNGSTIELQSDDIQMIHRGEEAINQSSWRNILGTNNDISLETPYFTDRGIAFGLNVAELPQNLFQQKMESNGQLTDYMSSLSIEPPIIKKEDDTLAYSLTHLWEEDTELYLIIDQGDQEVGMHAINVNPISNISIDVKNEVEIIPWTMNLNRKSYFYVSTSENGHTLSFQIPNSCFLLAVKKDNIVHENSNYYVLFEEERIPVMESF